MARAPSVRSLALALSTNEFVVAQFGREFVQITHQSFLKKGTISSVHQFEDEIGIWSEGWNGDPKPFIWKKPANEINAKVQGAE